MGVEMDFIRLCLLFATILYCNGIDSFDQLKLITHRRFLPPDESVILGAPSRPSHLPRAEAILPGHTLIRPSIGMLRSAIKFPHREQENGSGVYGHYDTIGIKFDGKNERLLYSKFRRMPTRRNFVRVIMPDEIEDLKEREDNDENNIILKDFINIVRSLRRQDEELVSAKDSDIKFDEKANKIKQFWDTKDSYNHIRIEPSALEHTDLLPEDALDKIRNWWFYNQDYEAFKER